MFLRTVKKLIADRSHTSTILNKSVSLPKVKYAYEEATDKVKYLSFRVKELEALVCTKEKQIQRIEKLLKSTNT